MMMRGIKGTCRGEEEQRGGRERNASSHHLVMNRTPLALIQPPSCLPIASMVLHMEPRTGSDRLLANAESRSSFWLTAHPHHIPHPLHLPKAIPLLTPSRENPTMHFPLSTPHRLGQVLRNIKNCIMIVHVLKLNHASFCAALSW